jgi:hypothetical protein
LNSALRKSSTIIKSTSQYSQTSVATFIHTLSQSTLPYRKPGFIFDPLAAHNRTIVATTIPSATHITPTKDPKVLNSDQLTCNVSSNRRDSGHSCRCSLYCSYNGICADLNVSPGHKAQEYQKKSSQLDTNLWKRAEAVRRQCCCDGAISEAETCKVRLEDFGKVRNVRSRNVATERGTSGGTRATRLLRG